MKSIHKTIISILIILMLATAGIYAKETNGTKISVSERQAVEEVIPNDAIASDTYSTTYTDIWFQSATNSLEVFDYHQYSDTQIFSQSIYLKYPSTVMVQFSSEVNSPQSITKISAWIDNNRIPPGQIIFDTLSSDQYNSPFTHSSSFTFARAYVPAGWHTIKVSGTSTYAELGYRTMVITANGYGH